MDNHLTGIIKDFTHYFPKRIYYSDTDAGGVVYHSRYLDMAEHARSELVRLQGGQQQALLGEEKMGFIVRSLEVKYNRPAVLDDTLTVKTKVLKCEAVTLIFDQKIYRDDELLAELTVKAGSVSLDTGRPSPMPASWRKSILEMMIPA